MDYIIFAAVICGIFILALFASLDEDGYLT